MILKDLLKTECNSELLNAKVTGITCDSRKVGEGSVFVCINGVNMDGHKFAADAQKSGAAAIITERDLGLEKQVVVENTRKTYAEMCAAYFGNPADRLKLIGITGTNGKTTTAITVKYLLESLGCKVGLIGTVQNMVGDQVLPAKNTTPDAYELHSLFDIMLKSGCNYAVMEVSSHAIDQDRVYGLNYEACVFTNLTQDHLDYHKTMENYLNVKKRLFTVCNKAVLNMDDSYYKDILSACSCDTVTYSAQNDSASYVAKNIRPRPDGVDFEMVGNGVIGRVCFNIPGMFSVYNAMSAASCAMTLGFDFADVISALSKAPGVKGRAEVVPTGRDFTVIIDYAHTPDGLKNITDTLRETKIGRLVTLFGCGGDRDKTKRPLMGKIAAEGSDYIIITSDNPRSEEPLSIIDDIMVGIKDEKTPYTVIENRVEAIKFAVENARPGDTILLAGKGHETYQILKTGVIHLDEREIVKECLESK